MIEIDKTASRAERTAHQMRRLEIEVPAWLEQAIAEHREVTEAIAGNGDPRAALTERVHDAILAGRDPLNDKGITAAAVATLAAPGALGTDLQKLADQRITDTLRRHGDELLNLVQAEMRAAVAAAVEAHQTIGDVDLRDGSKLTGVSPAFARAWADANTAMSRLKRLQQVAVAAKSAAGVANASTNGTYRVLFMVDITEEQWVKHRRELIAHGAGAGQQLSPWELICLGLTVDPVVEPAEFYRRQQIAGQAEERLAQKSRDAEQAQLRKVSNLSF